MDPALDEVLAAAHTTQPTGEPGVDTADLMALRAGALDPDRAAEVEAALLDDPEARALLSSLAEPTPKGAAQRGEAAFGADRRPLWIGLAAAAAVLIGVAWWTLRGPAVGWTLDPVVGVQDVRDPSAPSTLPVFLPDSPVPLVLRPGTATERRPEVKVTVRREGTTRSVPNTGTYAPSGVWRWTPPARALFGEAPGEWTIRLTVDGDTRALRVRYRLHR